MGTVRAAISILVVTKSKSYFNEAYLKTYEGVNYESSQFF